MGRIRFYDRILIQIQVLSVCTWIFLFFIHVGYDLFGNGNIVLDVFWITVLRYIAIAVLLSATILQRHLPSVLFKYGLRKITKRLGILGNEVDNMVDSMNVLREKMNELYATIAAIEEGEEIEV